MNYAQRWIYRVTAALAVCGVLACASSGTGSPSRQVGDVLTREEIEATQEATLMAAIRRLRPQWLRARGAARSAAGLVTVAVFVDDVRYGGTDELRDLPADLVDWVEFIDATDAATRYGLDVAGGVISVHTVRRDGPADGAI